MSTAAFPGALGAATMKRSTGSLPSLSRSGAVSTRADLTIHRITKTHHGRTLLTLGHAAEYLADTRRFHIGEMDSSSAEAIHILMAASRSVFEEFAERVTVKDRLERWLIKSVVRLIANA
jgi:hypothetical protein